MLRKLLPLPDQGSGAEGPQHPGDGLLAILLYLKRVARDLAYGGRLQVRPGMTADPLPKA